MAVTPLKSSSHARPQQETPETSAKLAELNKERKAELKLVAITTFVPVLLTALLMLGTWYNMHVPAAMFIAYVGIVPMAIYSYLCTECHTANIPNKWRMICNIGAMTLLILLPSKQNTDQMGMIFILSCVCVVASAVLTLKVLKHIREKYDVSLKPHSH